METEEKISFSFGENWQNYLASCSEKQIEGAECDLIGWMGEKSILGKSVIDIGSGSGIHSLAFHRLGADKIISLDADPKSVETTKKLHFRVNSPENWVVMCGSILDFDFIKTLGQYDIVYSWGVLHHTGEMWRAMENAAALVKPGGLLLISIYAKGPHYHIDLAIKRKYNNASNLAKRYMVSKRVAKIMFNRLNHFQNPFGWNKVKKRGMNVYHNIIDWLGGLPYEVASEDEIVRFGRTKDLVLERIKVREEGSCSIYLFSSSPNGWKIRT